MKSKIVRFLRFFLALSLLVFLVSYVGISDVFSQLHDPDYIYLTLFILVTYPLIWVSCKKWMLFIPEGSEAPSLHTLMRYYTVSYFANLFLPSTLGGDAARSFKLGKRLKNQVDALTATFLERLSGLLAMVIIALVVVLSGASTVNDFKLPIIFVALGVIGLSWVFMSSRGIDLFFYLSSALIPLRSSEESSQSFLSRLLAKVYAMRPVLEKSKHVFWRSLAWSFVFHLLTVVNTYFAARTIGWETVSFLDLCLVVPLVLLVSMIPLTPGGIGVQEGAFVYLLKSIGASPSEALSVALILRAKTLLLGVIGAWFFFKKEK